MKKIVFLICLMFLVVPNHTKASDQYSCEDAYLLIDDINGLEITKVGLNPYSITRDEVTYYRVTMTKCESNHHYIYGYIHNDDSDTYYDGYLLVLNQNGEIIKEMIIDYENLEEVKDILLFNNMLIMHVRESENIDDEIVFKEDHVVAYDSNYEVINEMILSPEIRRFTASTELVLISQSHNGEYEIGIRSDFTILNQSETLEINDRYTGSVNVEFLNEGMLNNQPVSNGLTIDYPGIYQFIYNDQIYDFVVDPEINGVLDKQSYSNAVSIEFSNGNATLNNEPYMSGEIINEPGNYTLEINGVNNYKETITFKIVPEVTGVIDGHTYQDLVNITFKGEAYLNNNFVESPLLIEEPGEYILRVKGVNGYMDTYQFHIVEEETGLDMTDIVKNIDIFLIVIVVVSGIIILKKK